MQRFRVDLKTFVGLAMPNQCCHAVKKWFLDEMFGQETPKLIDPYIYNTTILYDIMILRNYWKSRVPPLSDRPQKGMS